MFNTNIIELGAVLLGFLLILGVLIWSIIDTICFIKEWIRWDIYTAFEEYNLGIIIITILIAIPTLGYLFKLIIC